MRSGRIDRRTLIGHAAALAGGAMLPAAMRRAAAQSVPAKDEDVTWIATTETAPWQTQAPRKPGWLWDKLDVAIDTEAVGPAMQGFGACFNELGWTSLSALSDADRDGIFKELFAPGVGANFNLCRMPVGANDFARGWYSYDETTGDFALAHFSIDNDKQTLVPFIQNALAQNPALELWASPWSPPSWMKRNHHYAAAMQRPGLPPNGLTPEGVGKEGTDLFIQEQKYFETYAKYFGRFIDAYREQGIEIGMVMPQNEFNSAQPFPSCTWTPEGLARLVRHLGPEMARRGVEVFFGTLERGNEALLDAVMADPDALRYIKGVGVQWAGKSIVGAIHRDYPSLTIYQSEQECGFGKNAWSYAGYCWNLMKHYLASGAAAYMYWNISLETGGLSHWGWPQNSLVTVDAKTKSYRFNHEYYLMKHASHFIQRGARRLGTHGTFDDVLAYRNPDASIAVLLRNESPRERAVDVAIGGRTVSGSMPPDSFNTLLLRDAGPRTAGI